MLLEKLEVVGQLFAEAGGSREDILGEAADAYDDGGFGIRALLRRQAEEHIPGLDEGKERFIRQGALLSQAFALPMPHRTQWQSPTRLRSFTRLRHDWRNLAAAPSAEEPMKRYTQRYAE